MGFNLVDSGEHFPQTKNITTSLLWIARPYTHTYKTFHTRTHTYTHTHTHTKKVKEPFVGLSLPALSFFPVICLIFLPLDVLFLLLSYTEERQRDRESE